MWALFGSFPFQDQFVREGIFLVWILRYGVLEIYYFRGLGVVNLCY